MVSRRSRKSRKSLRSLFPLVLALCASVMPAAAQPPSQAVDLNPEKEQELIPFFLAEPPASLGNEIFFTWDDGIHGIELWKSDGDGASLVKDICPGACGARPAGLILFGGRLLFVADDAEHGRELWATDGTAGGTVLVADIRPGTGHGMDAPWMIAAGGALYLSADDGLHGFELWKSDGTPAGTGLIADIRPGIEGSDPLPLTASGGTVLLEAGDDTHGREPWLTDGTAAGTRLLKDIRPGAAGSELFTGIQDQRALATSGGLFLFPANDGVHGLELWASDGTEAGTVLVKDFEPGPLNGLSHSADLTEMAGAVYFMAYDEAHGNELWRTDGTEAGTSRVRDIRPGGLGSSPQEFTVVAGRLLFRAFSATATVGELWASDGTEAGTVRIKEVGASTGLTPFAGQLLFFAGPLGGPFGLWKSDGTEAGTSLTSDFGGQAFPTALFIPDAHLVVGSRFYFRAFDAAGELDLWASDGTTAGTGLVADATSLTSSIQISPWDGRVIEPSAWGALGQELIWLADDGTGGNEPWATDGTAGGTRQLAEIAPGAEWSFFYGLTPLAGNRAVFSTGQLWTTDGTPAGTDLLIPTGGPEQVAEPTRIGSTVFFSGSTAAEGQELWKTDGTEAGTVLVKDLLPGAPGSSPFRLTAVGSTLFFVARLGVDPPNQELWKSDGTANGTVLVKDVRPGVESSGIDHATAVGGRLFFSADDGVAGREPWVSDGTAAGTFRVKDIAPGSLGSMQQNVGAPAALGSTFFFPANDGSGEELWASDGTEAGTRRVRDIRPGSGGSEPRWLTVAGGRLFFTADDGAHGRELWVSDGTEAGTVLAADLLPGTGSSVPRELAAVGDAVVFSATDGTSGVEPWASDGTWARRLGDLAPGALPSSPVRFTPAGGRVWFGANDGVSGFELWSVPQSALAGPLDFYTVSPCRVADTRPSNPLLSNQPRTFTVAGACGIPAEARAVAVNLTAVAPNGPGFVTAWPAGTSKPATANLNYNPGVTRTNNGVVELGTDGRIDVQGQTVIENGQVHLVVDVVGYFR